MAADVLVEDSLWWSGPEFLKASESEWPECKIEPGDEGEDRKHTGISTFVTMEAKVSKILDQKCFSNWLKVVRVRSWIQRFLDNCRLQKSDRKNGELCPEEVQQAEKCIIKEA